VAAPLASKSPPRQRAPGQHAGDIGCTWASRFGVGGGRKWAPMDGIKEQPREATARAAAHPQSRLARAQPLQTETQRRSETSVTAALPASKIEKRPAAVDKLIGCETRKHRGS
jgi:hypothetical protein